MRNCIEAKCLAVVLIACLPLAAAAQNGPPSGNPPGQGGPPPGQGGAPPGQGVPPSATVQVDCPSGDSINAALETPAGELTIEINGFCVEQVVVERDHVALRGTDPAVDGVISSVAAVSGNSTFGVRDGDFVTIENLTLTGGFGGLEIRNSLFVNVNGCRLEGNTFAGAFVGPAARATFTDTVVTGNGSRGFQVEGATVFRCTSCTVDSPNQALVARDAARVTLTGGSYTARVALVADGPADLFVQGADLEAVPAAGFGFAVDISDGAIATLSSTTVGGPFRGSNNGQINFRDVTQAIPPGFDVGNLLRGGATLRDLPGPGGGTIVDGDVEIIEFSHGVLRQSMTVDGSLFCSAAGDAYCDDPGASITGSSNCANCPNP